MAVKPQLPVLVSPIGTASFAHLSKPDTEGKYADNKYKVTLKLKKSGAENQTEIDAYIEQLRELHAAARGKKKTESPVRDGDEKDNDYDKGHWLMTYKSKYAADLRDAGNPPAKLAADVEIRGGDLIRIAHIALPYEEGKNAGISLQMRAVQLVEKRAGNSNSGDVFEAVDGGFTTQASAGSKKAEDDDEEDDDKPY